MSPERWTRPAHGERVGEGRLPGVRRGAFCCQMGWVADRRAGSSTLMPCEPGGSHGGSVRNWAVCGIVITAALVLRTIKLGAAYLIALRASRTAGLIAGLAVALTPIHVYSPQEARIYALLWPASFGHWTRMRRERPGGGSAARRAARSPGPARARRQTWVVGQFRL